MNLARSVYIRSIIKNKIIFLYLKKYFMVVLKKTLKNSNLNNYICSLDTSFWLTWFLELKIMINLAQQS